jgi:peptidoglycan/xylan/chitin deacetylase (PgdA/CDA1 family)
MTPIQTAFHLLSSNRLTILIFHRVLASPDPIFPDEPDAARFDEMMGWIKSWFNVIPLDAAVDALKTGKLPARAAAITFDDGYADNHDVALPILQKHGLPATFFIATGFLDGGRMWNDTIIESIRKCSMPTLDLGKLRMGCHEVANPEQKRSAIENLIRQIKYLSVAERLDRTEKIAEAAQIQPPNDLMMTSAQVRKLRNAGMQIGAHTVSHPILARTDIKTARNEILSSKNMLESLLGEYVNIFAYPNGKPRVDYSFEHAVLVRELGFAAAVSTAWGVADSTSDLFQLRRFTPWSRARMKFAMQMVKNYIRIGVN